MDTLSISSRGIMRLLIIGPVILLVLHLLGCQTYPTRTSGSIEAGNKHAHVKVVFSDHDRVVINRYYKKHKHKKLPPGLAKKHRLPPGHQKQLSKHGRLPPGLEGRHLPHELERDLSHLPTGYVRVRIGTDIVLLDQKTRVVLDVIHDL